MESAKTQHKAVEKTLSQLAIEKEDCLARLKKVQKELELIGQFEETQRDQVQEMAAKIKKNEASIRFIDDALMPLKAERDKARVMVRSLAPHREYELKI